MMNDASYDHSIDIVAAWDLLTVAATSLSAVDEPTPATDPSGPLDFYAHDGTPRGVVGRTFALAGVPVCELEALGCEPVVDLYRQGRLPLQVTMGALALLHAAQQRDRQGGTWRDVLAHVENVGARYVDLVSDLQSRRPAVELHHSGAGLHAG